MRRLAPIMLVAAAALTGGCGGGASVPWVDPCGGACAAGEVCWAGACQTDTACAAPYKACPFSDEALGCTDLREDPYNCGGCGVQCLGGVCLNGVCRSDSNTCASAGLTDCMDAEGHTYCPCVDNDPFDCGACGVVCDVAGGESCAAGTCRAVTDCQSLDLAPCASGCSDLVTDPYNCGECGNVCMFGCDGLGACR
jgi:hypothetical protein